MSSASFLDKLATRLGVPRENLAFLERWQPFEGGGWETENIATYNPLNTTQSYAGSYGINSVGVQAFPNEDAGVEATAITLQNGYYPNILRTLQTGNVDPKALEPDIRTWGSNSFADFLLGETGIGGTVGVGTPKTDGAWFGNTWIPGSDKSGPPVVGGIWNGITGAWEFGTGVVDSATAAAQTSAAFFARALKALGWLLDPHHWFRLFFILAGGTMIGIGAYLFVRGDNAVSDIENAGKVAALA